MKAVKAIIGLAVLGGFGYGAWQVKSGAWEVPFIPGPVSTLPAGTEVKLLTLANLDAGKSKVGQSFPLVVAEDIKDSSGRVLIEAGSIVTGEVTRSRGGSLAATIVNQPARLEAKFNSVKTVDAQSSPLVVDKSEPEKSYEFTRRNAGEADAGDAIEAMWQHEETQKAITALSGKLSGEKVDLTAPDMKKVLADAAKTMDMPNTNQLLQGKDQRTGKDFDELSQSMDKVISGNLKGMNGGEIVVAAMALGEMGKLVGSVDKTLRNTLKGRSITVPIGTPVSVYTTKELKIKPKS